MKRFISIILYFIPVLILGQDIKVLTSDQNHIVVQYTPEYTDTVLISESGSNFIKFDISGTTIFNGYETGAPAIPVRLVEIGVPAETGNLIRIISEEYDQMNGQIVPVTTLENSNGFLSEKYLKTDLYDDKKDLETVTFGIYGFASNVRVQQLQIFPVKFDPALQQIKLLKKVIFEIKFAASSGGSKLSKDDLMISGVINPQQCINWGRKKETKKLLKANDKADLSTGTWYRFKTGTEGIYKITKDMLSSFGIPDNVDPRTIKIYNNGGYQLPKELEDDRPEGLIEVAIKVVGEDDGNFGDNDYIIFYGRPTNFVEANSSGNIVRNVNQFSKDNYYWITSGGTTGKRMQTRQSLSTTNYSEQTTTENLIVHENDLKNFGGTGRLYVGEDFNSSINSRSFINSLFGRISGSKISYSLQMINAGIQTDIPVKVYENENSIRSFTISKEVREHYIGVKTQQNFSYSGDTPQSRSVLKISCTTNSSTLGYLDYFTIKFTKNLMAENDSIVVFGKDTTSAVKYKLSNFSNTQNIRVFDVTDYSNIKEVSTSEISGGDCTFILNETRGNISKYFGTSSAKYRSPETPEKVENSNLRGDLTGAVHVIISPKEFSVQAERLRNYRENNAPEKISSKVVYVEDIFNEFGGGSKDPTAIRDFLKFAYDNWLISPKYILLFGDGTYDYYNSEGKNNNFIPTYQTDESLYQITSYCTDDYYVWVVGDDKFLDLRVGRLIINSNDEAENQVNKIIDYENSSSYGSWRSNITLVADDNYNSDNGSTSETEFTSQSETLSNYFPDYFDVNKIYMVNYPLEETGSGKRRPEVTKAIINSVNNGTVILNYIGHGNPEVWAHEQVLLRSSTIPEFKNDKLFFLTAATCDFAKYDFTNEQSGAEEMLMLKNSGAVGVFAATRKVYSTANAALNNSFFNILLNRKDSLLNHIRVGDAFLLAVNSNIEDYEVNTSTFHLFCDPFLKLDFPKKSVLLDSLNGSSLTDVIPLKALSRSIIKGKVTDQYGKALTDFTGEAIITIYDGKKKYNIPNFNSLTMVKEGGAIFRGRVSVVNGEITSEFIVPKDISYENLNGKIVGYVYNDQTDGIGFSENIIVGGADSSTVDDNKGPDVNIYFDDTNFENAYIVNPDFKLIVDLSDETGLNTTGLGIGHKIEAIIDGDAKNSIDLSNYFVGDLNSGGKSGKIEYSFLDYESGTHDLTIKAWDVFNNSTIENTQFTVVNDEGLVIRDIYNYPNPFSSNTVFTFQHNYSGSIGVRIKIYTIAGRLVREIEKNNLLEKFVKIDWDGRDEDGDLLANGTYLYKVILEPASDGGSQSVLGKLAIIR